MILPLRITALTLVISCVVLSSCSDDFRPMTTMRSAESSYSAEILTPTEMKAGEEIPLRLRILKDGVPSSSPEGDDRMILGVFAGPTLENLDFWMSPVSEPYPGVYDMTHTFARAGQYRVWLEIADNTTHDHHATNATLIAFADLSVGEGKEPMDAAVSLVPSNGYSLELQPTTLRSGTPASLKVVLRNPQGKSIPFIQQEPFMSIIVREDFSFYLLDHGVASADPRTGIIPVTFPAAGTYHLMIYSQFFDAGVVRSVKQRFTVEVR